MSAPYIITSLSPILFHVRWLRKPNASEGSLFVQHLSDILERAEQKTSFISDLSHAWISDSHTVQRLAQLARHDHYGVGLAYGLNFGARVYVDLYSRVSGQNRVDMRMFFRTLPDTLRYLETILPGSTAGADISLVEPGDSSAT